MRRTSFGLLGVLLVALGSCADKPPPGPDFTSVTSVFDAAMEAVARPDLDALWPLLTARAMATVQKDLLDWQHRLRDPVLGPKILAEVRRLPGGEALAPEDVERAKNGTISDVWRFFLRAKPRPAKPPKGGLRTRPDGAIEVLYQDVHGDWRPVTLTKVDGRWLVDDLQL